MCARVWIFVFSFGFANCAMASIYCYKDESGIVHFSNAPSLDSRYQLCKRSPVPPAGDDVAINFLDALCIRSLEKTTIPKAESRRFCACVQSDIAPRLSVAQRSVLNSTSAALDAGRAPNEEQLKASGIRDLVIASQARCEASFYPPTGSINVSADGLDLTMRCDHDKRVPEAFVYIKKGSMLSETEIRAADKKMMGGNFDPYFAQVTQKIDGAVRKVERWEIDISGQIVSPLRPADLIDSLRSAKTYEVAIQHGRTRHTGLFQLGGKIPARWAACGGMTR